MITTQEINTRKQSVRASVTSHVLVVCCSVICRGSDNGDNRGRGGGTHEVSGMRFFAMEARLLWACIRSSYLLISSGAWTSCRSTHSLSESGYPFHFTKYCSLPPRCFRHLSRIFSTSYSSAPSTVTVAPFSRLFSKSLSLDMIK